MTGFSEPVTVALHAAQVPLPEPVAPKPQTRPPPAGVEFASAHGPEPLNVTVAPVLKEVPWLTEPENSITVAVVALAGELMTAIEPIAAAAIIKYLGNFIVLLEVHEGLWKPIAGQPIPS
jgi:hypothetical protein